MNPFKSGKIKGWVIIYEIVRGKKRGVDIGIKRGKNRLLTRAALILEPTSPLCNYLDSNRYRR